MVFVNGLVGAVCGMEIRVEVGRDVKRCVQDIAPHWYLSRGCVFTNESHSSPEFEHDCYGTIEQCLFFRGIGCWWLYL